MSWASWAVRLGAEALHRLAGRGPAGCRGCRRSTGRTRGDLVVEADVRRLSPSYECGHLRLPRGGGGLRKRAMAAVVPVVLATAEADGPADGPPGPIPIFNTTIRHAVLDPRINTSASGFGSLATHSDCLIYRPNSVTCAGFWRVREVRLQPRRGDQGNAVRSRRALPQDRTRHASEGSVSAAVCVAWARPTRVPARENAGRRSGSGW